MHKIRSLRMLSACVGAALILLTLAVPSACSPDKAHESAVTPAGLVFDDAQPLFGESDAGAAPILALAPDGRHATAWVTAPDGGSDGRLHVLVARDSASTAPTLRVLTDPLGPIEPHGEAPPKLAWATRADGRTTLGALYVVGRLVPGRRFPASALRFVRSDDGGVSWSAPVTVTDDTSATLGGDFGSHNFHALHAAPDGTFHVAWLDGRSGPSAVFTTHSSDGGITWARNVRVVAPSRPLTEACPCCRTAIAADANGHVYLAWRAVIPASGADAPAASSPTTPAHADHEAPVARQTIRDVVVARSDDGGTTWQPPVRVHADNWVFDGCPHAGPSLALDSSGVLHVAWWTGKRGAAGVWYARSLDRATSFDAALPLGVAEASQPAHVQLALQGQTVYATWDDGTQQAPQIVVRTSYDGGRSFAPPVPVSAAGRAAGFPVVTAGPGTGMVRIAWSEQTSAGAPAAASARPDMRNPQAVMPLPRVGSTQLLLRHGRPGNESSVSGTASKFRPLTIGDQVPAYGAPRIVATSASVAPRWQLGATHQPTVLNVWATWCTSCREEMDDLQALHRQYASRGVEVVGVSVDRAPSDRVQRFVRAEQLTFPIVHDSEGRIESILGVVGVPETLLLDATGRVRWKTSGNVHGSLPSLRAALDSVLAEAAPRR